MNISEFLRANYVYIVIVVVLIIVTIIGFLADKKKNGSKKKADEEVNNQNVNNAMAQPQMNMQPNGMVNQMNNIPVNQGNYQVNGNIPNNNLDFSKMNTTVMPVNNQNLNNGINPINNVNEQNNMGNNLANGLAMSNQNVNIPNMQPTMDNSGVNNVNVIPVEPVNDNTNINAEPLYQPLSEQKPTFNSNHSVSVENLSVANMQPVNTMPTQMNVTPVNEPVNVMPTQNPVNVGVNIPMQTPPVAVNNTVPNNNIVEMPNVGVQNVGYVNQGNISQMNNSTTPTPMPNPIPNTTGNTMPEQINTPPQVNPSPINFVYGNIQGQNNQNM